MSKTRNAMRTVRSIASRGPVAFAIVAFTQIAVTGCGGIQHPNTVQVLDAKKDAAHPPTYEGLPLKNGQIILTESPDATSFVFMLIPDRFYNFTHAAVIVIENGEPFVYEVAGEIVTFPFHTKVLDNVTGKMAKRPLFEYVSANLYGEIFDPPPGVDGNKVVEYVKKRYYEGAEFDAYFRWDEHEKLFCTELVELAEREGGAKPHDPGLATTNPSVLLGMEWLGVPKNQALPAGYYYDPSQYVAALGQFSSRTAAYAYFEAKRELYRRMHHQDQRLGYMFRLKSSGTVELRAEIQDFALGASHLFDDVVDRPPPGDPRIARAVRRFADATFGPAPE